MIGFKLALAGMDVCLPGIDELDGLENTLYRALPLEKMRFDQPRPELIREDALLLKVSRRAVQDAGLPDSTRIGVLFARGSRMAASAAGQALPEDAQMQSLAAEFNGPLVDLSAHGNPLAAGLAEARRLLETGAADAVLFAAVSLLQSTAGLPGWGDARLQEWPRAFGYERGVDGWKAGEGAAAVVLMRPESAPRAYACIEAAGWSAKDLPGLRKNLAPGLLSSDTVTESCGQAFEQSGIQPGQVGYLDGFASGFTPLDTAEINGLVRAYRDAGADLSCALGSVQQYAGYLFTANGVAALARTALCLHRRVLPAAGTWSGPKKAELWHGAPFYVNREARTWFLPGGQSRRIAALNAVGRDASCAHILLSDMPTSREAAATFLAQSPVTLFPLAADTAGELSEGLTTMQHALRNGASLSAQARAAFERFRQAGAAAQYSMALVAASPDEMQREIDYALRDLGAALEHKKTWQTPAGSFFTPEPVGRQGGVAFVYPGAFNSYLDLGRELFLLFPQLYEHASRLTGDLGATIQERRLYPRSLEALDKDQLAALESQLNADPIAMITTGSLMAVLFTMIVRDIFLVKPAAAFGYSLGEIAMLFGTGVWVEADATRARLQASPLFQSRLAGAQLAVREHWGASGELDGPLWSNYFLMAPVERVEEALRGEKRVYLTHVNTPRQVVIGGDPQGCRRVIDELKCTSLKAPFDFSLHCPAIRGEYERMLDLHTWPVAARPAAVLYSADGCRPMTLESRAIAERISTMLCSCLDFPSLVRQVYADGARVFIELGANANCSKWIDETLKGSPYAAVAINRRGADDHSSILRMLARLVSHRVPLDLTALYPTERPVI